MSLVRLYQRLAVFLARRALRHRPPYTDAEMALFRAVRGGRR